MMDSIARYTAAPISALPRQSATDAQLVELWLHGRSPHTQRAYRADVARFLAFVATTLATVTLGDVQAFSNSLACLAPSSRTRAPGCVLGSMPTAEPFAR